MAQEGTPEKSSDASATDVSQIIFGAKNLEYQIDQFVSSGGQSVNILLSGKTGVGKSHLTNALIGENLALEGYDIDPQTDDVTPYKVVKNGVSITVYDTPGLADATGNDEEYLRKIKEKVTHFDLFLFCTEMTSKRFRTDDLETIKKLTAALGEKLWDHALVVLTFANEVPLSPTKKKDDGPEVNVFNDRFLAFKKAIKKHLVAIGVPEITVTNVPFTPAGELDDPRLPDREDWLTAFWVAAFKRINRNAKAAFLMANVDRIAFSSTFGEGNEEDKGKKDGNIVNLGPQFSGLSTEERNAIKVLRGKWQEFSFDKISSLCLEEGECLTTTSQSSGLSTEERDAIKVLREKWQEFSFDKLSSFGLEKTEAFYGTEEECPTPPGQSTGLSIEERNAIKEVRRRLQKRSFDKTLSLCLEKTETSDEPEEECPTPPGQVTKVSGPSIKVDETNSKDLINEVLGDVTGQLIEAPQMAEKDIGNKSMDTTAAQLSDLICYSADLEHYLREFILSGSREITFLLGGKTGVGKSHLTNALIGEELAEEGEELDPKTDDVTPYDFVKNGVKMTVFDTPGLADGTGNDEKYLKQIKKKVKAVDLFLFCFDMTSTRFRDDDVSTIRKLTRTFGRSLWDHALVVLTFANKVQPLKDDVTEKDFFQERIRLFRKEICKMLVKEEVHEKALDDLPFVPAGVCMRPTLPDRDNWLTAFWIEAFKRINRNVKAAFLIANINRITISVGGDLSYLTSETQTGEGEGFDECSEEEMFFVRGSLEKSSPVISTRDGKCYREILERIKAKQMTPTTISNSDTSVDDDHDDELILGRGSALVSNEVGERFRAWIRERSVQGPRDESCFQKRDLQNSYGKCASSSGYDINDDNLRQSGRTFINELKTERQTKSPHFYEKTLSLPPSYDEAVRNPAHLPMDESTSQDLFIEMAKEALHDYKPGKNVGASGSRSSVVNIYARLFRKTIEFIKSLLRGRQNQKTEM